jgi:hypothetical protein
MRKLILKMSVTIDGFVGGPNGDTRVSAIGSWVIHQSRERQ